MLHKCTGSPEINMSTFLYFAQLNTGCSGFFTLQSALFSDISFLSQTQVRRSSRAKVVRSIPLQDDQVQKYFAPGRGKDACCKLGNMKL